MKVSSHPLIDAARAVTGRLRSRGHVAVWAGGCVRDLLLHRECKDIDIATSARPEEVEQIFPRCRAVGRAFGVVLVTEGGFTFEVATFRTEGEYRDGRRPSSVSYADARQDALRRDFTINAMFLDPATNEIMDWVGGREDLSRRRIRCVGDPETRFREDHLRLLRAARFAATLEFDIEKKTAAAIRACAVQLKKVSAERIRVELTRLLTEAPHPGRAVRQLQAIGLLGPVLPEVAAMEGVDQPPDYHPEGDAMEHTCRMLDAMGAGAVPELAWAVLLHDTGKPPTARRVRKGDVERWSFPGHDREGAAIAGRVLRRLRFSNRQRERIVWCIAEHMKFLEADHMRPATLMQWAAHPDMDLLLEMHRLDRIGGDGDLASWRIVHEARERIRTAHALPRAMIRGTDAMRLGVPAGPEVGRLTREAYRVQLEHPDWDRERLLRWLSERVGIAPPSAS